MGLPLQSITNKMLPTNSSTSKCTVTSIIYCLNAEANTCVVEKKKLSHTELLLSFKTEQPPKNPQPVYLLTRKA